MEQISDHEKLVDPLRYTHKAFINFLYGLASLGMAVIITIIVINYGNPSVVSPLFILFTFVFSMIGLVRAIQSFVRKEPKSTKKYVGLFGNLFFVLFFLLYIIRISFLWYS